MKEIIKGNNYIEYRLNHATHRANGPAVTHTTDQDWWSWFLFGRYHRYYGPMSKSNVWSIHGEWLKW